MGNLVYHADVAIGTTATLLPNNPLYEAKAVFNKNVWVGGSGVTVGTGTPVGAGREYVLEAGASWYAISRSPAQVDIVEYRDKPLNLSNGVMGGSAGDSTAYLNAFFSSTSPLKIKKISGTFLISDSITIPEGVYVDASGAVVSQTASNKPSFIFGGNSITWFGGELVGKGTDYTQGTNNSAIGISATSVNTCKVLYTYLRNFSGAAIKALTTVNLHIDGCRIEGVGSPTIITGDGASCYGVWLDTSCTDTVIVNTEIFKTCQGIITGLSVTNLTLANLRIHDIVGQHGAYLQNGSGVSIMNVDVQTINMNGIKLQLSGSSTGDSISCSISGLTAKNCLDTALSINNIATDLTSAYRIRGLVVSNISGSNCNRLLYLGSVRGGSLTGLSGYNNTGDGITLVDCQDVVVADVAQDVVGRVGIRLTTATGGSNQRVTFRGIRIRNPGNANVASTQYGIYHLQGDSIVYDDVHVSATNGFMVYTFFLASATATDQETAGFRNCNFLGDARFRNPATTIREWSNNRVTSFTFKPTGFVAVTAVP